MATLLGPGTPQQICPAVQHDVPQHDPESQAPPSMEHGAFAHTPLKPSQ
jgi:hypothetical protein